MRIGLTSSLAVHTLILGWGLVTFSSPRQFDPVSIPSIPVELISFDVLSRVVQGTDRGSADKEQRKKATRKTSRYHQRQHEFLEHHPHEKHQGHSKLIHEVKVYTWG